MASDRKRAANRDNARKSTGPKSAQGKTKVSGNARRHGFSARGPADEHAPENLRRIADAICGDDTDPMAFQLAMTIADAQISIAGVRVARIAAIKDARVKILPSTPIDIFMELHHEGIRAMERGDIVGYDRIATKIIRALKTVGRSARASIRALASSAKDSKARNKSRPTPAPANEIPRNDLDSFCLAFPQLIALERYERRAIARRKRAIEQLNAIRQTRAHRVKRA